MSGFEKKNARIVVAITGASGIAYGIRLLEALESKVETHLILSAQAEEIIPIETAFTSDSVKAFAHAVYSPRDLAAPLSSGSFPTDGMVVLPCTIKTLSGIANSYSDNLIIRAADVTLKERRKLVLAVRETPLHLGHLKLMVRAAEMGAILVPPIPAFYHAPKSIQDIIDHSVGKVLDLLGVEHNLYRRWKDDVSSTQVSSMEGPNTEE